MATANKFSIDVRQAENHINTADKKEIKNETKRNDQKANM